MPFFDDLVDVATALGKGVYSVGEDIVLGAERTAEGLGMRGTSRISQIGRENELLVGLMTDLFRYGVTMPNSPLYDIISTILLEYYDKFPEEALQKLAKAGGLGLGYMSGRMVIGKMLATKVTTVIAMKIAQSAAYKQFAKKIGVSAGVGATGIGVPITLLMIQGVGQRASAGSQRLRGKYPTLYNKLRAKKGLDLLYFLVEKPMAKHLDAIFTANLGPQEFQNKTVKVYEKYDL